MMTAPRRLLILLAALGAGACAGAASNSGPSIVTEDPHKPANAFEEAFAKESGVRPVTWGGWIKTETEGSGASPTADSVVTVNYRGTLTDGTEFDSSYKHGEPATFSLRNVISCWTNGVPLMKVGEKAKFVCPASAAYGDKGSPPSVPGNATLVFEIELLRIVK